MVENEIQDLRNRLMKYEYDFDWWGVTSRTMEQAGGACVRQLLGHKKAVGQAIQLNHPGAFKILILKVRSG